MWSRKVSLGAVLLGVLCLAASTVTISFATGAGTSARLPAGFAAAAIVLIALDLASRPRRRRRYRAVLLFALVGVVLGLAGWGVNVERVSGRREGRVVSVNLPPFASFVRSSIQVVAPGAAPTSLPATGAELLRVTGAVAVDATDRPLAGTPAVVHRLGPLAARIEIAGASTRDGTALLSFGWSLSDPRGRTLVDHPAGPPFQPVAAEAGVSGFHALAWPGTEAAPGSYTLRLEARDGRTGTRVTAPVTISYAPEAATPAASAPTVSDLVPTQPAHPSRAQPHATYVAGDTVNYNVLLHCPAGPPPCTLFLRSAIEPLAPTPGVATAQSLPPVTCTRGSPCAPTFYLSGLRVGRYRLSVSSPLDPAHPATREIFVLPPHAAR